MKKILVILGILAFINIFLVTVNKVFAYDYTPEDKKTLYDAFEVGFFDTLTQDLLSQGFEKNSVYIFIAQSKANFNRKELENSSWDCVSKYSPDELNKNIDSVAKECFYSWLDEYVESNMSVTKKYLVK